jgi:hypothetical protein
MKKRFEKKLTLSRETLRHLQGGTRVQQIDAGLPTTPIGTCPASDPAACGGGGGTSTVECTT